MPVKKSSKDILIETTSRLFRIRGYYGVGLNDIIEESGIPKGSLYHYFPKGKEQLAIEAIQHTKELVLGKIKELFESIEDPVEAFQEHFYKLSKVLENDTNLLGFPIGTVAGEKHSTCDAIRVTCQSAFEEWQGIYTKKLLVAGFNAQEAKDLSVVINALIEGGILLSLTQKSGAPLKVIAEKIPVLLTGNKL